MEATAIANHSPAADVIVGTLDSGVERVLAKLAGSKEAGGDLHETNSP